MMKLWIYENHIYELRSEELNQVWSSQLYKQLLQLRKEKKIIILSRVYNEPIQRPAPRWLVSLIGRAMHWYRKVKGSNPVQAWIFLRLSFRNYKSCVYNCDDHTLSNSSLRSSHIWFSYTVNTRV